MTKCEKPTVTNNVVNSGHGARAYCAGCTSYRPAAQVPHGKERRVAGRITATYAPIPH